MSKEEQSPFLDQEHDGRLETLEELTYSFSKRRTRILIAILAATNLLLLIICTTLAVAVSSLSATKSRDHGQEAYNREVPEPYSPAAAFIEYQYRPITLNDTRYVGHPGPEWEQSMHDLMDGTLIRISDEELMIAGSDSIPLKDGGYAAGLGVGHNLHCIKKLKKFIYREHFYPNLDSDKEQFEYLQSHADHCLDFLRQDVLCHLDYSLYTLYWGERRQDIPTHRIPRIQKCVNWDKLHAWMRDRQASTDMLIRS